MLCLHPQKLFRYLRRLKVNKNFRNFFPICLFDINIQLPLPANCEIERDFLSN